VAVAAAREPAPTPVRIQPTPATLDRSSAGKFFQGVAWAGGAQAAAAHAEPSIAPSLSIAPVATTGANTPPASANPLLAATRSALVTAEKTAAPAVNPAPAAASEPAPTAPAPATPTPAPAPTQANGTAAAFFRSVPWKN
jgi:hypothetical protein